MSLTILTTPTRFPLGQGKAWEEFDTFCLMPHKIKLSDCRVLDATKPLPRFTAADKVIALGPAALDKIMPGFDLDRTRSSILPLGATTTIASYHPQDAYDRKAEDDDDDDAAGAENKDTAITRRSNYFFWIRADVAKYLNRPRPPYHPPFRYLACPPQLDLINWLTSALVGQHTVYIDIETLPDSNTLSCIGLAIDDSKVVIIPIYDYRDELVYSNTPRILALLCSLLTRHRVVAHNSLFDLFMLSRFYRVASGWQVHDTMYTHHRIFPEIEKSLAHCMSYWTYLPYHKDINIMYPRNADQQYQHWKYCALDVYGTREVAKAQWKFIGQYEDVSASTAQANDEVYPYLLQQLQGVPVDEKKLLLLRSKKNRRVKQLRRICRILSGVPGFNPGSSKQCIRYFHDKLAYAVVGRTKEGAPKMDTKSLYKLRIKYPNPLLEAVIAYRVDAKAYSMMNFENYERPTYEMPSV